jgi:hypothetical protein
VGWGSLQAPDRPATLDGSLGRNLKGRVHRVVLFKANDEMVNQRSRGRCKPTLRGEHQMDEAGLLAPIREKADEAAVAKLLSTQVLWDQGDAQAGDGRGAKDREFSATQAWRKAHDLLALVRPNEPPDVRDIVGAERQ